MSNHEFYFGERSEFRSMLRGKVLEENIDKIEFTKKEAIPGCDSNCSSSERFTGSILFKDGTTKWVQYFKAGCQCGYSEVQLFDEEPAEKESKLVKKPYPITTTFDL